MQACWDDVKLWVILKIFKENLRRPIPFSPAQLQFFESLSTETLASIKESWHVDVCVKCHNKRLTCTGQ